MSWATGGWNLLLLGCVALTGCSGRPSAIEMIDVDPAGAAREAIEAYDKDGDDKLSSVELKSIPGILKRQQLYDLDSDSFITQDEIAQRLKKWQADKMGFRSISANVKLDGKPVPNVLVTLTPEPYLGKAVKPATGTTNERGFASLSVAADDLPEAIKKRGIKIGGVYPGTYKITLSGPQKALPNVDPKGNPLGDEVARDTVDASIDIAITSSR